MPVHCQHLELAHSLPSMSQFFISGDQNFSFSISTVNEQSGLISFRIDLFDLLAVQGTLKRILQHQSSKTSVLWCSAFFMLQLSHPYTSIHDFWKAELKLNTQKKKIMAPPSVGFSRQDYWSGLPFPSPGDLPDPGIKARSPIL